MNPAKLLATLINLLTAMLVAVEAGSSQVSYAIAPAIAPGVLVFQCWFGWARLRKGSFAVAAPPLLLFDETVPQAARVSAVKCHRI